MFLHRLLPLVLLFAAGSSSAAAGTFFDSTVSLTATDSTPVPVGGSVTLTAKVVNLGTAAGSDSLYIDISDVFTIRRVLPSNATVSVWSARLAADVNAWE